MHSVARGHNSESRCCDAVPSPPPLHCLCRSSCVSSSFVCTATQGIHSTRACTASACTAAPQRRHPRPHPHLHLPRPPPPRRPSSRAPATPHIPPPHRSFPKPSPRALLFFYSLASRPCGMLVTPLWEGRGLPTANAMLPISIFVRFRNRSSFLGLMRAGVRAVLTPLLSTRGCGPRVPSAAPWMVRCDILLISACNDAAHRRQRGVTGQR